MLATLTLVYKAVTQPLPLLGLPVLDIVGALRLSIALRQIRAILAGVSGNKARLSIDNELARNIWTNWTVVWGGETILCALLAQTPSFLISPVYPLLFLLGETIVYFLPSPPAPSLPTELPLSILDAFTRVGLLTSLAFGPIAGHGSPDIARSPLALLISATLLANGGFFLVSSASMLSTSGWKPALPNELKPWGWTAVDLWSASLVTGIFALLTKAQPWWADLFDNLHRLYASLVFHEASQRAPSVDADDARAVCLTILMVLFASRALWNHSSPYIKTLGKARRY